MNLKELCKAKGTNIKRLAEQLNVSQSTLYSISNGATSIEGVGISLFIDIANALDCTTDELYCVLVNQGEITYTVRNLTESETALVDNYRALSTAGRSILDGVVQGLLLTHPKNNELRANPRTA